MNSTTLYIFLGVLLIKNNDKLEFGAYRKPFLSKDFIHFCSHNTSTKRVIIISLYQRAFHICSPKYLNEEFNYIEDSILNLLYTVNLSYILLNLKPLKFTTEIDLELPSTHPQIKLNSSIDIILLNNSYTNIIGNNLNKLGIKTVFKF